MNSIRLLRFLFIAFFVAAAAAPTAVAHDIPNTVSLHAFLKPEGDRLHLLVRVPLVLLGTLELPTRGPGFVELSRVNEHLKVASATVANELVVRADGERLVPDRASQRISHASDKAFESYARA